MVGTHNGLVCSRVGTQTGSVCSSVGTQTGLVCSGVGEVRMMYSRQADAGAHFSSRSFTDKQTFIKMAPTRATVTNTMDARHHDSRSYTHTNLTNLLCLSVQAVHTALVSCHQSMFY